jgi:error-prone DNA polymerase
VLAKTLGVPIFQEQVMKLAVVAADYTPGEADQLRRDMAAWRKAGRIERHRERLISRMMAKGIEQTFAERVFEQIRGFGEYGFPESHAASFALIAYATAYLKCHYPAEFFCSLLNAQPMGFYTPATLVATAQRCGVEVRPIDVQHSDWHCSLEPVATCVSSATQPLALRMGLRYLKGFSLDAAKRVIAARFATSLETFVQRTQLDEAALLRLAEAGALEGFDLDRRQTLWQLRRLLRERGSTLTAPTHEKNPVFEPLDALESIGWDYDSSWHSARGHPLEALREQLQTQGIVDARQLWSMRHGARVRYAGLVICRQRPGTASGVTFMTLEDESGLVNAVVWRDVYQKHRTLVKTSSFLGISGKLQVQDGVSHLIAEKLWLPQLNASVAHAKSRDFH